MKRKTVIQLLMYSLALLLISGGCAMTEKKDKNDRELSFTNPLPDDGEGYSDPWVIRSGKTYYYCGSNGKGQIFIKHSQKLPEILAGIKRVIYETPLDQPYSKEIWAPELHFVAGRWYVYFAADDGNNENHRMYCLVGGTDRHDPLSSKFKFAGQFHETSDRWAIDGTILHYQQHLYFIWSGWSGTENVAQNLYIAPMSDPKTISGPRVLLSEPTRDWETNEKPAVNEGPQILQHNKTVSLIYSASGSWSDNYCLGELDFKGGDPLNVSNWSKQDEPVFQSTKTVFGPGHASFIQTPISKQNWIIYHAAISKGSGWERDIRLQRFTWRANDRPDFGIPISPGKKLEFRN